MVRLPLRLRVANKHPLLALVLLVAKYALVALIPLLANFLTFRLLLENDVTVKSAIMAAWLVGGQVSFWSHDRLTFGDRHVSLHGWIGRWWKFMPGQAGGFLVNTLCVAILVWLGASPMTVYLVAMFISSGGTFAWNNWFSHRLGYQPKHRRTKNDKARSSY